MNTTTISKQFITDSNGRQIGVILPIEDYILVEPWLRQREQQGKAFQESLEEKIDKIKQAASDPRFLADLQEVMNDFAHVDAEWWEREK
jgi:hypothetical protein